MKKIILFICCLHSITFLVYGQTNITNSAGGEIELSVEGTPGGADALVVQGNSGTDVRTILQIAPKGTNEIAFLNVLNSSDPTNTGQARIGIRGNYGILSAANRGTPSNPLSNFAIELDPLNTETGEGFVISSGDFLVTGTPTILAKVDAAGLSTIEAKVQASVAAPDYVFKSDYNLRTLEEVQSFINKNGHLPEIPSAADFEKNGIVLGKMSFDLLKKVEELTLYMIELKKENKKLNERISTLESK